MDNSSGLDVIEKNVPRIAQSGTATPGPRRQIANEPATLENLSLRCKETGAPR
jgi:hypothetical protein